MTGGALLTQSYGGTHRILPPEETLQRISPLLPEVGVTRLIDLTGLDRLGVPVFTAVRPTGTTLQVSMGKGVTPALARCSALMEAIEQHHSENPMPSRIHWASETRLQAGADRAVHSAHSLTRGQPRQPSPDLILPWVEGEDLLAGDPCWLPASSAYFCEPEFMSPHSNGLASGNHAIEATLHAVYELLERHTLSRFCVGSVLRVRKHLEVVNPESIDSQVLQELFDRIQAADTKLILMRLPASISVHTFWAVLINMATLSAVSSLNLGYGCHTDAEVAASRAITEACQSRLCFIHGTREDIHEQVSARRSLDPNCRLRRFFESLNASASWQSILHKVPAASNDIEKTLNSLLLELQKEGHTTILRHHLTEKNSKVAVVKVMIPTLAFEPRLF
jgi:ribosomal protein S12 methylthiotransferase accessory factor